MKRIVICCDGTWNRLDARNTTNVAKLAQAVLPFDREGTAQIVLHLDGVGSGRGTGGLSQRIDRFLGGAFGVGLTALIQEAYRFLVLNYAPGDEVLIFGFSRGAYTARSLGGLIRRCGIMERRFSGEVAEALDLYRARGSGAAATSDRARRFRAKYSAHVVTDDKELSWRAENDLLRTPAPRPLELAYLGVWDTVGSLGVPSGPVIPAGWNARYRFHDVSLGSIVRAARHAVAIDEHRRDFSATLWDNLAEIEAAQPESGRGRHLQQWFPGVHGAVGGGARDVGLSNGALVWVAEGAMAEGLALDPEILLAWRDEIKPKAPLSGGAGRRSGLAQRILALRRIDRDGPAAIAEVSERARDRWHLVESYRPRSLDRVAAELDIWMMPEPKAEAETRMRKQG